MARPRKDLDARLRQVLEKCDVNPSNCYFQPPSDMHIDYPCIVYNLAKIDTWQANNDDYLLLKRYDVTVIDEDPDSKIPETLLGSFDECFNSRAYTAGNLNHYAFTLYF